MIIYVCVMYAKGVSHQCIQHHDLCPESNLILKLKVNKKMQHKANLNKKVNLYALVCVLALVMSPLCMWLPCESLYIHNNSILAAVVNAWFLDVNLLL